MPWRADCGGYEPDLPTWQGGDTSKWRWHADVEVERFCKRGVQLLRAAETLPARAAPRGAQCVSRSKPYAEEPDAGNPHVRIRWSPGERSPWGDLTHGPFRPNSGIEGRRWSAEGAARPTESCRRPLLAKRLRAFEKAAHDRLAHAAADVAVAGGGFVGGAGPDQVN